MCNLYCTWNKQSKLKEYLNYILKNNVNRDKYFISKYLSNLSIRWFILNIILTVIPDKYECISCKSLRGFRAMQLRNRQIGRDEGGLFLTSNHEFKSEMFRPCIVDWYILHLKRIVIDTHKFVATPYDCNDVVRYDVSNQVLNTL